MGIVPLGHAHSELLKKPGDFGSGFAGWRFVGSKLVCQFSQIRRSERYPGWPAPLVVGISHANIDGEPVHTTGADAGIAKLVQLPWPRHREITRTEIEAAFVGHKRDVSGFDKMKFNTRVSLCVDAPILRPSAIPESDTGDSWQGVVRRGDSGIMVLGEGRQLNLAGARRQDLGFRNAGIARRWPAQHHRTDRIFQHLRLVFG